MGRPDAPLARIAARRIRRHNEGMDQSYHSELPAHWPRVWRGENGGELFEQFDNDKTRCGVGFFFAVREDHAASYAGCGTQPRAFVLDPGNALDLRDPYHAQRDPAVAAVLNEVRAAYDDWTDRVSGEPMDLADFLEAGDLYNYEGTGTGERWNQLFAEARGAGFDSVLVRDQTDGVHGDDALVWVVFEPRQIHFQAPAATPVANTPPPRRRTP